MNVVHANPIVVAMAESRPQEAMVANRYNFRVVTTGQGFVSVSELPTCMVPGPSLTLRLPPRLQLVGFVVGREDGRLQPRPVQLACSGT